MQTAEQIKQMPESVNPLDDAIGLLVRSMFDQAEQDRKSYEENWLQDLRQYKGVYEPDVLAKMDPNRSKAFVRLTRTKVKTMDARMSDMLFPKGSERNWDIEPTPVPEFSDQQLRFIVESLAAQGIEADEETIKETIKERSDESCNKMKELMADQLGEADYEEACRKVIHQGNMLGTGVLKGPMVETITQRHWQMLPNATYQMANKTVRRPFYEFVPLWDIYPDLSAKTLRGMEFVFQRHIMNRADLRKLARRKDFKGDKIREYMKAHPTGDAAYKSFEVDIRGIYGDHEKMNDRFRKYEVLEMWGYMDAQDLRECGCEIPEGQEDQMEFEATVWVIGNTVIKAALNPTEQQARPFHFYRFEESDDEIFGTSIPTILRDTQSLFNSAVRLMVDNAAISAGPQIEANLALLDPSEDVTDVFPFKVWVRKDKSANAEVPAIRVHVLPSYTNEFMAMAEMFKQLGDEASTIPSYMHGENDQGVGKTVGGLSMLMGAANITVKDVVKNYDDGITEPSIEGLYHWNMQFSERNDVKGDFQVLARGSSSLVAKELRAQRLNEYVQSIGPQDEPYIKRGELNRHRAQSMDLPEDVVRTDDEYDEVEQMRRTIQELAAMLQGLGINPETGQPLDPASGVMPGTGISNA